MSVKRILISQPEPEQKSPYHDLIKKYSLEVTFKKFFCIEPVPARDFRKLRIDLATFSAVIFTSKIAADHFFRLAEELRYLIPTTLKYYCINETIANYLSKFIVYRKRKIFFADGDLDNLVELVAGSPEEIFLLPVADNHKNTLNNKLKRKKLNVTKAVCYKTVSANLKEIKMDFDVICLFSPSGVAALRENYPDYTQNGTKIAAFGEETHKAVVKAGLKLDIKAPTKDCPSMAMALEKYINNAKK